MIIPSDEDIKRSAEIREKISAGLAATRDVIIKKARFHNTPIVTWEDGKMVEIDPFSVEIEEDKNNKTKN